MKKLLLKEGGNIFKDPQTKEPLTKRIDKADVIPTLQWLEKITNLPHEDFMLGTTGKKDTSGDLDVAVNQEEVTKEDLVKIFCLISSRIRICINCNIP